MWQGITWKDFVGVAVDRGAIDRVAQPTGQSVWAARLSVCTHPTTDQWS